MNEKLQIHGARLAIDNRIHTTLSTTTVILGITRTIIGSTMHTTQIEYNFYQLMVRLTLGIATFAPAFIQRLDFTLKSRLSEFRIDLIVLLAKPNTKVLPRFSFDWFMFKVFGKVGCAPRTRVESSDSGKETDH